MLVSNSCHIYWYKNYQKPGRDPPQEKKSGKKQTLCRPLTDPFNHFSSPNRPINLTPTPLPLFIYPEKEGPANAIHPYIRLKLNGERRKVGKCPLPSQFAYPNIGVYNRKICYPSFRFRSAKLTITYLNKHITQNLNCPMIFRYRNML